MKMTVIANVCICNENGNVEMIMKWYCNENEMKQYYY